MIYFLIKVFVSICSALVSLTIFRKISKKYDFYKWIKVKLHINSKIRAKRFVILAACVLLIVAMKFTSIGTVHYYAIMGFIFGFFTFFLEDK